MKAADRLALAGLALVVVLTGPMASPAVAGCHNNQSFAHWLQGVKREAAASGIGARAIRALDGLKYDKGVIRRDRAQGVFGLDFITFSNRVISRYRLKIGRSKIRTHARTFARIKKRFGVPAPVITAFWGLETDFGGNMGKMDTLRSLATLAYDCRRPDLFRPHLMDALRLIDRGDLPRSDMIGAWAGEIGHTQFMPSDYLRSAVDFDGDGHRNLRRSVPDALASTANVLAGFGWRRGEPWLKEVIVPRSMPWDQADLAITHPLAQWARWGVRLRNGAHPGGRLQAALLLPMGRNGPAFLAFENFRKVYLEWNKSLVYSLTAGYFATRLAGAPAMRHGNGKVTPLSHAQIRELQLNLKRRGFDVGKIDGIIGSATRAAVKAMQVRLGLPADSYPTPDLLRALR